MNVTLNIRDKAPELDEHLDQQEMACSDFWFYMESLLQFVDGDITIDFGDGKIIELDLGYDFFVCHDEIIDSVASVSSGDKGYRHIWFCEQGSDFYLYYETVGDGVRIEFKKGPEAGYPNRRVDEFSALVDRTSYVEAWRGIFNALSALFDEWVGAEGKGLIQFS